MLIWEASRIETPDGAVVFWCRLQEDGVKMDVVRLRVFALRHDNFEKGAVSNNMLYLTAFSAPISGALWGIDLSKPDAEPEVRMCFHQAQKLKPTNQNPRLSPQHQD